MPTQQELKQQGNIHFQKNNFEKAIEFYTLAIEKDAFCDEAAPILSNRSLCYYNVGKYKEAYEDGGCCCGIRPDWAKGFARRGAAAEELKEWQIALESYDEYLKLDKSDEMGIRIKQRSVKRHIDTARKNQERHEQELRSLEQELSKMKDVQVTNTTAEDYQAQMRRVTVGGSEDAATVKKKKVYKILHAGCEEMSIGKIELAVKHGADLGEHFLTIEGWRYKEKALIKHNNTLAKVAWDQMMALRFTHMDFSSASDAARSSPLIGGITSGAKEALNFLLRKSHLSDMSEFEKTNLLIKQREYFDRLLDLPNKQQQHQKYVPPPQVNALICEICSYSSGNPIRDDLVMILLENGKKYFVGDDVSEREFKKIVLRFLLIGGLYMATEQELKTNVSTLWQVGSPSSNSSLRKLMECLQTCLSGLSAEDLNSECDSHIINSLPPLAKARPLVIAASLHNSPFVAQLLLDRGANPEAGTILHLPRLSEEEKITRSEWDMNPLYVSLVSGSVQVAQLILSRGAKLPREKVPDWAHARFEQEKSEMMMTKKSSDSDNKVTSVFPQEHYSPLLEDVLTGLSGDIVDEEKIRLIFDALADQNLSLFALMLNRRDGRQFFVSPLDIYIHVKAPVELIACVIKVRPKLLYTPSVERKKAIKNYCFGFVLRSLQEDNISLEYAKKIATLFMETGLNFLTTVAARYQEEPMTALELRDAIMLEFDDDLDSKTASQLEALCDYCIDFEKRRGNA